MCKLKISTDLAQLGNKADQTTGAISSPIYLSTTYSHPKLGQSTGYDYTRTKNPTRDILETGLARLENGARAVVTSSGMSAIQLVFQLFESGSKFLVSRDLYGGTFRFFNDLEEKGIAKFRYFDDFVSLKTQYDSAITAVFLETPTNPLMNEIDIKKVSQLLKDTKTQLIVDNTFLTPLRQKPLDLGADVVIHSGTKYLTGHNDVLAGVVVAKEPDLGERIAWIANTTGPTLSSFDCWLFIRSLKTFPLRFNRQEESAQKIVKRLEQHPSLKRIAYPGKGGMISFYVKDEQRIAPFLAKLKVITFAESLGGVESLITYPTTQTHADIPQVLRESYGLTSDLLRLSVGIEDSDDLITDLEQALTVFD
ncbi:PLP-dependent transferase [Enterococcus devriesei]|uniref:PLP-dependent transferase n=1 Tax=Enterococcus devriesei TaxID=319970 RepID=UPI0028925650|nr:PLP-dependent transferase [Enterococcus devriesei]MDT2820774.1 PLP-dependent transferase [Enterococcus devriesei]